MNDLATSYYEDACRKVPKSLALMTGLFYCYVRGLSFFDQLKISLKMCKFDKERRCKFFFWSVVSIQTQVFYQLLTKLVNHDLKKPETLLVCISVKEVEAKNNFAYEILSKLGLTLLVAELGEQRVKGVRLLARVSNYTAAAEVLKRKFESCSLDDWDRVVNNLCQLLGKDIKLCVKKVKINQTGKVLLSGSQIPKDLREADLSHMPTGSRCVDEIEFELDNAIHEYFNRLGSGMEVSFQVLPKVDEIQLVNKLREKNVSWGPVLQKAFSGSHTIGKNITSCGRINPALKTAFHGTSICIKTNKYIIVAADGKLTSRTSYNALKLKADKVTDFGNMCAALSGNWINSAKMISTLGTCMRFLKDENKSRPTISKFADFIREKLFSRMKDTEIMLAGFDKPSDGGPAVPRISYATGVQNFDIGESFFCCGTGSSYANMVLSNEKVCETMELDLAIASVEKALVYTIHVIENGENGITIKKLPRESIHSTLWNRYCSWLE
ncbi:hypothetical protein MKW98_029912, partial [Papaver atlanticum]